MECTPGPSGLAPPLQPAKSGAAGHAHAVSEPKCSAVPAEHAKQKTDSSAVKKDSAPLDAVNERLNIIEDMLARVAEALPPSGSQAFAEEYWADYGGDEPATTVGEERELEAPHGELPAGGSPGGWYATSTSDRRRLKIFFGDDGDPFIRGQIRSSNRSRQSSGQ